MKNSELSAAPSYNPPVFFISSVLIFILLIFSIIFQQTAENFFTNIEIWIQSNVSWFYILTVAIVLLTVVFMAISRFGDIRLGPDHSRPDYSNVAWFAMLFSTGMGIGLIFFGVAEPLLHFTDPPIGEGGTIEAAREAMKITFFHWGLHAWAIYAIVGLILAYFSFRHNLPLSLRSALYPLIGQRIYGPIGHAVDIFAILGTVFGIATSLGYGVEQINAGLYYLFGIPINNTSKVVLIILGMGIATISVASGLNKGIKFLSQFNLIAAVLLLVTVLLLGPTVFLLKTFIQNTGDYLSDIIGKTFNLYAYQPTGRTTEWMGGWTLLYWGWWLSWSPFVGLFIARISRGRTIREFVFGVLLVPTLFTLLWMSVFGNAAIYLILNENTTQLANVLNGENGASLVLFEFFQSLPLSRILSVIAIFMVLIFFVTSADSGVLVLDLLASSGKTDNPLWQRLFWSILMTVVAIVLLLAGGLSSMRAATIASALPFAVVLLFSIWGLFKALQIDAAKRIIVYQPDNSSLLNGDWQRRLRTLLIFSKRSHVTRFIQEVVQPAYLMLAEEWRKQGYQVDISEDNDGRSKIVVLHGKDSDFIYEIRPKAFLQPSYSLQDLPDDEQENRKYFRAEVYLREGGQDYDVMGWSREDIISDILNQYERHLHFLHVTR